MFGICHDLNQSSYSRWLYLLLRRLREQLVFLPAGGFELMRDFSFCWCVRMISIAGSKGPHRDPCNLISSTNSCVMSSPVEGKPQVFLQTIVPCGRTSFKACEMPLGLPVISTTISAPNPSVALWILSIASSGAKVCCAISFCFTSRYGQWLGECRDERVYIRGYFMQGACGHFHFIGESSTMVYDSCYCSCLAMWGHAFFASGA